MSANQDDPDDEQVEIYRSGNELEVNRVLDELLAPEGIDGYVHNRTSRALPASGEMGNYFIAVPAKQADAARQVLRAARDAGELGADLGELIQRTIGNPAGFRSTPLRWTRLTRLRWR